MKRPTPVLGVVLAVLAGTTLAQQYPTRRVGSSTTHRAAQRGDE